MGYLMAQKMVIYNAKMVTTCDLSNTHRDLSMGNMVISVKTCHVLCSFMWKATKPLD